MALVWYIYNRYNDMVDYLFYKDIDVPTLTLNKSKLTKAYEM